MKDNGEGQQGHGPSKCPQEGEPGHGGSDQHGQAHRLSQKRGPRGCYAVIVPGRLLRGIAKDGEQVLDDHFGAAEQFHGGCRAFLRGVAGDVVHAERLAVVAARQLGIRSRRLRSGQGARSPAR